MGRDNFRQTAVARPRLQHCQELRLPGSVSSQLSLFISVQVQIYVYDLSSGPELDTEAAQERPAQNPHKSC